MFFRASRYERSTKKRDDSNEKLSKMFCSYAQVSFSWLNTYSVRLVAKVMNIICRNLKGDFDKGEWYSHMLRFRSIGVGKDILLLRARVRIWKYGY